MSDTQWSVRADATKALVKRYDEIYDALEEINNDEDEKPDAKDEAGKLVSDMERLEIGILAALWHKILQRFHTTSQALQSSDQDLNTTVALYESLIEFVHLLRTRFLKVLKLKGRSLVNVTNMRERSVLFPKYGKKKLT